MHTHAHTHMHTHATPPTHNAHQVPDCESQLTEHESLAVDIDTLLTKLRGVNDDMCASCEGGGGGGSRSQQHLVQVRGRERVSPRV